MIDRVAQKMGSGASAFPEYISDRRSIWASYFKPYLFFQIARQIAPPFAENRECRPQTVSSDRLKPRHKGDVRDWPNAAVETLQLK